MIVVGNTSTSTLMLVAKDVECNALTELNDSLAFTIKDSGSKTRASEAITESTIIVNSTAGIYTVALKRSVPGKYTIVSE
ncbi:MULTISPECIES: hypothetical protein [Rahnella]|uniref:hypothetical protein n=1 Tax=Rahnella TaxID=34037 RepID=UPI003F6DD541